MTNTEYVTIRYDLSSALVDEAIRSKLIELGWIPPDKAADAVLEQAPEPVAWTTKGQIKAMESGFQHYIQGRVPRFVSPSENDVALYTAPPHRALAQEEQEPVAWMSPASESMIGKTDENGSAYHIITTSKKTANNSVPLYTQPSSHKEYQEAYSYAKSIAEAIWKKHYKDIAPHWKPHSDLLILLTQIDNMTTTLRPAVQ